MPILVEIDGGVVRIAVNLPFIRSAVRRVFQIADLAYVQDADWASVGQYQHGVRIVGLDGSVSLVWFPAAHRVRSALAHAGVEVRPPFEDSSPGHWGRGHSGT